MINSARLAESILRLFSRLPLWMLYRISDLLFLLVYFVVRYRRKVVRENLSRSFPDRSKQERRLIERRFYRFFCVTMQSKPSSC